LQEFFESCGQFERILKDSGFVRMKRLSEDVLLSNQSAVGLLEKYCFLCDHERNTVIKDIQFKEEFRIGNAYCQLYTWLT
jgi:hypothetical protein